MLKKVTIILLFSIFWLGSLGADEVVSAKLKGNQIEVTFTIPEGLHQSLQKEYFYVDAEEMDGITFQETIYPEGEDHDGEIEYRGSVTLIKKFTIDSTNQPESMKIYAGYQFCHDSGTCLFPQEKEIMLSLDSSNMSSSQKENETVSSEHPEYTTMLTLLEDFTVIGVESGYHGADSFAEFLHTARLAEAPLENAFDNKSIWLIIALILLGGIALNLTPCVLPMLPVTLAILGAGTKAESKGKGFFIGSLYGMGMALAYGVLGLIVVLTGSQFGQLNSSPIFNIIIAVLFLLLALATFDVITIDFSRWQSGQVGKKSKSKYITVFLLGIVAAVLAGACVAPILISVILYATTLFAQGQTAGLLLPFLLGVGMALPWPFAGAGLSILPKPGNWMKWVKIIFGIVILVLAFQYGFTAYKTIKANAKMDTGKIEKSDLPWIHSITEGLKQAQEEQKPVFIDFWATWCKNCLAMDASTFRDEKVKKELENFVLIKYQAEKLKESPTKEILNHFTVIGLPTYIVLKPIQNEE